MLSPVFDEEAYHVAPDFESGWAVRRGLSEGGEVFRTKAEAEAHARQLARRRHTRLYIHREDGTVEARHTYA